NCGGNPWRRIGGTNSGEDFHGEITFEAVAGISGHGEIIGRADTEIGNGAVGGIENINDVGVRMGLGSIPRTIARDGGVGAAVPRQSDLRVSGMGELQNEKGGKSQDCEPPQNEPGNNILHTTKGDYARALP